MEVTLSLLHQIIGGRMVADSDVHPACNVYGRKWIAGDMHGTFRGEWPTPDGLKPPRLFWLFSGYEVKES